MATPISARSIKRNLEDVKAKLETTKTPSLLQLRKYVSVQADYYRYVDESEQGFAEAFLTKHIVAAVQDKRLALSIIKLALQCGSLSFFQTALYNYASTLMPNPAALNYQLREINNVIRETKSDKISSPAPFLEAVAKLFVVEPTNLTAPTPSPLSAREKFESALANEDAVEAWDVFNTFKTSDAKQHRGAYRLALLMLNDANYTQALEAIDYALAAQPKNVTYLQCKASVLRAADDLLAWRLFVTAHPEIKLSPTDAAFLASLQNTAPVPPVVSASLPVATSLIPFAILPRSKPQEGSTEGKAIDKQDAHDINRRAFYKELEKADVLSYKPIIKRYLNERQFDYRWRVTSQESIELIENKFAIDLKYLDMRLRELILPYIIKIEVGFRTLYQKFIGPNDANSVVFQKIADKFDEEFRVIFDDARIHHPFLKKNKRNLRKFRALQMFMFFQIRNFLMHGGRNLFDFALSHKARRKIAQIQHGFDAPAQVVPVDWSGIGDVYDEDNFSEATTELQKMQTEHKDDDMLDMFFEIPFLKDVMTPAARANQHFFGIIILFLFLANERPVFLNIVSNMDSYLNEYRVANSFGARKTFYEALGIDEDWVVKVIRNHSEIK